MNIESTTQQPEDLICFSHLRWSFVFQRPQHLMSRFARWRRVFFVEEPEYSGRLQSRLSITVCPRTSVYVVTPLLPDSKRSNPESAIRDLLRGLVFEYRIRRPILWFYTPMALDLIHDLSAEVAVYDCMDELSLFRGAPPSLCEKERALFRRVDLVFTGGASLFECKRSQHSRVYAFPSGVEVDHFRQARGIRTEFAEHRDIPHPRLGFAGVIDERMDLSLIGAIAEMRPAWQIVMLGPVVKIDRSTLPRRPNVHWLGMKDYSDLPRYFAGWDVGLLPFALNDSTRFISPTKTPEYLAAGLPVVSTPIRDVVRPYGELGLARIASNAEEFVEACECSMTYGMTMKWSSRVDAFLQTLSWDDTWNAMNQLIEEILSSKATRSSVMVAGGSTASAANMETPTSSAS